MNLKRLKIHKFDGIKNFPDNFDEPIYTEYLRVSELIFQGDGLHDMLVINLPDTVVRWAPSIILSNICDIDLQNERAFPSQIVYTTIYNLQKYCATEALTFLGKATPATEYLY